MTYPPPPSQDPLQPTERGRPGDDPQAPPTAPLSPWAPGQPYPGQPYPGQPLPGPHHGSPQGPPGGYPPGAGYPPQAKPPRRNNGPLVALVVVIALLLCGGTVTAGVLIFNAARNKAEDVVAGLPTAAPEVPAFPTDLPTGLPTYDPDDGTPVTVVYEVTGDGPVDLHYSDGGGSSKREKGVKLPWRKEFTESGAVLASVMASRATFEEQGSLTCRATVDGVEVAKRTVEGKFLLVSCVKFQA
jgi:hypothetical protein